MKRLFIIVTLFAMTFTSCQQAARQNPFLADYDTPFGVPPFEEIENEHFLPAIKEGILQQEKAIAQIVENPQAPDFHNTIVALDYSDGLLTRVVPVFDNYTSSNINDELQQIAQQVAPLLSTHNDNIMLNTALFDRVKAVYDQRESLELTGEQQRLLELTYKGFVRNGALLAEEQQERFREINLKLSTLSLQFGQNVLGEVNHFKMVIEDPAELAGLPQSIIDGAAEQAAAQGLEGQWVFTLHNPSVMPFLAYADNRELRRTMQQAYVNRGNNNNEFDNKAIIGEMVNLRLERANMLGYETHADFTLEENMAKNYSTVESFLGQLWQAALPIARQEAQQMQQLIDQRGLGFKLKAWDWRYFAEQVRLENFNIDEQEVRQYFELNTVRNGIFNVVNKLWGLQFVQRDDIPVYHPEATAYEVLEADGSHRGLLYMDFHPRASKNGGAWMSSYRDQHISPEGKYVHPVITLVCNFSPPTANQPSLLTYDEMLTFFHEFGHALHGLLSDVTYPSLSGTNVPRDFVELPSQIMENWANEPEVMKTFALHYQTGEPMPDELLERLKASQQFNEGFSTVEFIGSALLDMEYHTISNPYDVAQLNEVARITDELTISKYSMMPEIAFRHGSTHFQHAFYWGYSAGYYSYIWSGILDADAYEAFRETGDVYNPQVAQAFRSQVLEKGGTLEPMAMFVNFRGREPEIGPLLRQRGLERN